jgi:hypothetical protein
VRIGKADPGLQPDDGGRSLDSMKEVDFEQPDSRKGIPETPVFGDPVPEDCAVIRMHLREMRQLYDSLDPSPFHEKDLDPDAEDYIVESARELPSHQPCALLIDLDQPAGPPDEGAEAGHAIRLHFRRRSQVLGRKLKVLIRRGVVSLGIGLTFLAAVFVTAEYVVQLIGDSGLAVLLREGLLIVGWVAMWRPLEIFLYDWWPILGERRLYDRLSRIRVRLAYEP